MTRPKGSKNKKTPQHTNCPKCGKRVLCQGLGAHIRQKHGIKTVTEFVTKTMSTGGSVVPKVDITSEISKYIHRSEYKRLGIVCEKGCIISSALVIDQPDWEKFKDRVKRGDHPSTVLEEYLTSKKRKSNG